jgi:hypothetical protein
MKLSLYILKDWFDAKGVKILASKMEDETSEPGITGIRLKDKERPELADVFLYITESTDLESEINPVLNTNRCVVCVYKSFYLAVEGNVISIFNESLAAYEFFQLWESSLKDAVYLNSSLQDLVDLAVPVFRNPIFIANWQGRVFAFSREYQNDYVRGTWQHIVKSGRVPLYSIQMLRKSDNYSVVLQGTKAALLSFGELSHRCIGGTLKQANDMHLHIQIMEFQTTVTAGHCQLADIFLKIVSFTHFPGLSTYAQSMSKLFCELLNGKAVPKEELDWVLLALGWENKVPCVLLLFEDNQEQRPKESLNGSLDQYIPQGKRLVYDNETLLLLLKSEFDALADELTKLIQPLDFICGVSLPFTEWDTLAEHLNQAKLAIHYGQSTNSYIRRCEDFTTAYIHDSLLKITKDLCLCHPAILTLNAYDRGNEADLCFTLFQYLRCERNSTITSECLHIHRNTLQYRLKKIHELIQVDMNNPDIREHLMLSYEMIVKN